MTTKKVSVEACSNRGCSWTMLFQSMLAVLSVALLKPPSVSIVGDVQYVYNWQEEHCGRNPDHNRYVVV